MNNPEIQVIASPVFDRNIRTLLKKYRNVREDIFPIIEQLKNGETPGDQISGIRHTVHKLRIRNINNQKGKSGGYRLIYYLKTSTHILLLTLYSKSEQDDVAAEDLREIIEEYDRQKQLRSDEED